MLICQCSHAQGNEGEIVQPKVVYFVWDEVPRFHPSPEETSVLWDGASARVKGVATSARPKVSGIYARAYSPEARAVPPGREKVPHPPYDGPRDLGPEAAGQRGGRAAAAVGAI
eukprot:1189908-Prorocentrum_minimum.AAC.3